MKTFHQFRNELDEGFDWSMVDLFDLTDKKTKPKPNQLKQIPGYDLLPEIVQDLLPYAISDATKKGLVYLFKDRQRKKWGLSDVRPNSDEIYVIYPSGTFARV